jgi:hypothetical protein
MIYPLNYKNKKVNDVPTVKRPFTSSEKSSLRYTRTTFFSPPKEFVASATERAYALASFGFSLFKQL